MRTSFIESLESRCLLSAAPIIDSASAIPSPLTRGAKLTITAAASDTDGTVKSVDFFVDTNGNGTWDPVIDKRVARDGTAANGFNGVVSTANTKKLALGTVAFFVIANDNSKDASDPALVNVTVENSAPTIKNVVLAPKKLKQGKKLNIIAAGLKDVDGKIASASFFEDANGNGAIDVGTDTPIGTDSDPKGGFKFTLDADGTDGIDVGNHTILAQVTDTDGGVSNIASATLTVVAATGGGGGGGGDVVISIADKAVSEADADATVNIPVTLNHAASGPVTVHYQSAPDTALAPTDYGVAVGDLTFLAGETTKNIPVLIPGNTDPETFGTFTITLSSPVGGTLGQSTANIGIHDDDLMTFTSVNFVNGTDPFVDETVSFTATVDAGSPEGVAGATIQVFFAPQGADLSTATPIKTFDAGLLAAGGSFTQTNVAIPATGVTPTTGVWQFVIRAVNLGNGVFDEVPGPTFNV